MDSVTAFAPATVANLGSGFDILGMAVEGLGDTVTIHRTESGLTVTKITGDNGKLPRDPDQNTAAIAARYVRDQLGITDGMSIEIEKGLPLASGLGSSAASAVAAACAANALFGNQMNTADLLPATLEAEAIVSGRHADNVAPSLLGGILLITGIETSALHPLPVPDDFYVALVTPDIAVPTAEARAVLPKHVKLSDTISQTKAVSLLIHALYTDDVQLLAHAMQSDVIIEPARKHLIPHFDEARQTAIANNGLTSVISGAGPTLCIPATSEGYARQAGEAVQNLYVERGIAARLHVSRPSPTGAMLRNG
jgi:homoserine kinase